MTMQAVLNAVRLQAMLEGESRVTMRLATVRGYDPNNYTAKVLLQPENIETGWLPIASPWVGNGWGFFAPPTDGDVVKVTFQEEDIDAGIISLRMFTDRARPLNVPSGECWIVHKSGSALKFHNDGSVEVVSHTNLTATVGGALTANVTGIATINASEVDLVGAGGTAKGIVQADCLCAFTNAPHPQVSAKVKGSM